MIQFENHVDVGHTLPLLCSREGAGFDCGSWEFRKNPQASYDSYLTFLKVLNDLRGH